MANDADVKVVTDSIYTMVEGVLGAEVRLEIITTKPEEMPQMMVHTIPNDPVIKRYKCGDYLGKHDWGLYLRIATSDTAARIDAVEALNDAAELIRNAVPKMPAGFEYGKTKGGLNPTLADATDQYETWQVTFSTEYKRSRER